MAERNYSVKIIDSAGELTAKERIMLKDLSNTTPLEDVINVSENGKFVFNPTGWVELEVHNEQAENKDYKVFVVVTNDEKYATSSVSFKESFLDLFSEVQGLEEEWSLVSYHKESKNYKGKSFITCSLI